MEKSIMGIEIKEIIRAKRKTIALQITYEGNLIVKAPFEVSDKTIKNVVIRHLNWIERKKKEVLSRDPKFAKKEFVNGEGFLYIGKHYRLMIVKGQEKLLIFRNAFFLSQNHLENAKEEFISWYKEHAYEKISERVEWYAKNNGFIYGKVKITSANKRWGSCSPNRNLNFSWWLIMAPLAVIDYVVVHELAHLEEKSHSKIFWSKVKTIMPDYKKHIDWLKTNGYLLK
jgi:hypothetical protein